jgi:hypothetical protein
MKRKVQVDEVMAFAYRNLSTVRRSNRSHKIDSHDALALLDLDRSVLEEYISSLVVTTKSTKAAHWKERS